MKQFKKENLLQSWLNYDKLLIEKILTKVITIFEMFFIILC